MCRRVSPAPPPLAFLFVLLVRWLSEFLLIFMFHFLLFNLKSRVSNDQYFCDLSILTWVIHTDERSCLFYNRLAVCKYSYFEIRDCFISRSVYLCVCSVCLFVCLFCFPLFSHFFLRKPGFQANDIHVLLSTNRLLRFVPNAGERCYLFICPVVVAFFSNLFFFFLPSPSKISNNDIMKKRFLQEPVL